MSSPLSRRELFRTTLRASTAAAIAGIVPGCGDGADGSEEDLRAAYGPRPFYVVGHNPNTIADVKKVLAAGANAIEPDVNVYSNDANKLCISHGKGSADAPTLEQYLTDLNAVAKANPQLSLIVFDCKPPTVSADNGARILAAIRTYLTHDVPLNIIISVSAMSSSNMFDRIKGTLAAREGVMIDEENDPVAVGKQFTDRGITNYGYGNGISVLSCGILGPNVRPSMEQACALRASALKPRFIYVWTVDCVDLEAEYVRIGVDGVITDDPAEVRSVLAEAEFKDVVRLANRADNPFEPKNFTYSLTIKTGDVSSGGTDAHVTFTLNGTLGSATKTVDTKYIRRMERGDTNYVTIQAADIGALQSITVQRDTSGNGPDWYLDYITVSSARYRVTGRANFGKFIGTTPQTVRFG